MENTTSRKQCPPPNTSPGGKCLPLNHQHHHFLLWEPYQMMNHTGKDLASPLATLGKSKLVTEFVQRPKPKIKVYRKTNIPNVYFRSFCLSLFLCRCVCVYVCVVSIVCIYDHECTHMYELVNIFVCTGMCRGHRSMFCIFLKFSLSYYLGQGVQWIQN